VPQRKTRLSDVTTLKLEIFQKHSGKLVALQHGKEVPWQMERIFFITTQNSEDRGDHAHFKGHQAFVCTAGSARLICKDGNDSKSIEMDSMDKVVFVPPGIWTNISLSENSSLAVMTDRPYEDADYIRQWEDFMKHKGLL
jgi:hypothetical protein